MLDYYFCLRFLVDYAAIESGLKCHQGDQDLRVADVEVAVVVNIAGDTTTEMDTEVVVVEEEDVEHTG